MKRIRQFERTDRDITNALLQVMDKKSFEKITVQDILDEAMINRSTFYLHFSDKFAILERLQEKYVGELTKTLDSFLAEKVWDIGEINRSFCAYLADHRPVMKKLLTVRTESLDMEEQLQILFLRYLRESGSHLAPLERELLAGILVKLLVHFVTQEGNAEDLSGEIMQTWLHLTLYFFRVDDIPDAGERLMQLIGELHAGRASR